MRTVLFNPGPVMCDPRVHKAALGSDLCHREHEVRQSLALTRYGLTRICGGGDEHDTVVLTGSGSSAVEAILASVIRPGRLLVLDNGHYGQRIAATARALGVDTETLQLPWGTPIDPDVVRARLEGGRFTHVAMVHHETSTGMLNDVRALGQAARGAGAEVILDAVSSVGCEGLDISRDPVDWLAGSANKCIEGLPGLSFVTSRKSSWSMLEHLPGTGPYLDLSLHARAQIDAGAPAFTPAVQTLLALETAVELTLSEGVATRRARYAALTRRLRDGLEALGLRLALSPQHRASMLTAVGLPDGWTFDELHARMRGAGFVIYASQGPLRSSEFRLATMGTLTAGEVDRFLASLAVVLAERPVCSTTTVNP